MTNQINIDPRITRIKVCDVLDKVSEAANFENHIDVEIRFNTKADGGLTLKGGNVKLTRETIGKQEFKDVKQKDFLEFCRAKGITPRNPNAPWVDDYDGNNPSHNGKYDISVDEFRQYASGFDLEVLIESKPESTSVTTKRKIKDAAFPAPVKAPEGGDALTPMIWEICNSHFTEGKSLKPKVVMNELKRRAAQTPRPPPLLGEIAGGVKFEYEKGDEQELNSEQLRKRIDTWKKNNDLGKTGT